MNFYSADRIGNLFPVIFDGSDGEIGYETKLIANVTSKYFTFQSKMK